MAVAFPEMMSWNIYFFYFLKLSDNNVKCFENNFYLYSEKLYKTK